VLIAIWFKDCFVSLLNIHITFTSSWHSLILNSYFDRAVISVLYHLLSSENTTIANEVVHKHVANISEKHVYWDI